MSEGGGAGLDRGLAASADAPIADAENQAHGEDVPLPPVSEVIEQIGFGWAQMKAASIGGGIWLADGAELLLITSVTTAVAKEWGLGPFERGFVVSVVFFGILVGNIISGPVGDNFGRRRLLVASFLGIFIFSICSSLATGYLSLCLFRFIVGIAIGIGQPAWTSLGSEISPSHMRAAMMATGFAFFTIGEIYSAGLLIADDPAMKDLHWRRLLQLGAIPSFFFCLLTAIYMHESPIYLAHAGQHSEAKAVLEAMRDDNSAQAVPLRFSWRESREDGPSGWVVVMGQLSYVFSKKMFVTTTVVMFSCFVLNLNCYGCMYAFPQLLPDIVQGSAAAELMIGAVWEFPGSALGCLFGLVMERKRAMKVYLGLSVLGLVAFPIGASAVHKTWFSEILLYGGYYGTKCFVNIGFVIVYQYAVEVYPTEARITGSALNLAAGRIAATAASLIYELIVEVSSFQVFFFGIAIFCVINAILVDFLQYETMGMQLKDSIGASGTPRKAEKARDAKFLHTAKHAESSASGTPAADGSYGAVAAGAGDSR